MSLKHIILAFCFLVSAGRFYGQSTDSLEQLLSKAKSSDSIVLLNELTLAYTGKQPEKAVKCAEKAIRLAEKLSDYGSKANALTNLGDLAYFSHEQEKSIAYYDQALAIYLQKDDEQNVAKLYNFIGLSLYELGDYSKSRDNYEKAQSIYNETGNTDKLANVLNNIGVIYKIWGDYEKALSYHNRSLEIEIASGDNVGIAGAYNNIGTIYKNWGKYETALEYYHKSLNLFEKEKVYPSIANTLNKIGILYYEWNDLEKAVEYYEKALMYEEKSGNIDGVAHISNNLGLIFKQKGKAEVAINHFKKVYEVFNETGNKKGMANALTNVGEVYIEIADFKLAQEYLKNGLDLVVELNDQKGMCMIHKDLGDCYLGLGDFENAFIAFDSSVALAKSTGLVSEMILNYSAISRAWSLKGDYKKSLDYYKKHIEMRDSLYQLDKHNQLSEMQVRFETEQKDKEIGLLKKDSESQQYKENVFRNSLIFGAVFFFLLVGLLFSLFIIKQKANKKLVQRNEMITEQADKIGHQAEQLEKTNNELEQLSFIAQQTASSILVAGPEGNIIWANEGFTILYGSPYAEFKESRGSNLCDLPLTADSKEAVRVGIKNQEVSNLSFPVKNSIGKRIWVQSSMTPIFDENGNLTRFICIDMDITHIKEAEEEVKASEKELIKAFKKSAKQQLKLLIAFEKINYQQQEITGSIEYAERIQLAVMPPASYLKRLLPDHFILFKPRDIVSGDFYWAREIEITGKSLVMIAAADCTGHGVPGAFMSMLGVAYLNEIVNSFNNETNPELFLASSLLNKLREKVIVALHQTGEYDEADDGMDIALCIFDLQLREMQYSGAHNPLYIYKRNQHDEEGKPFLVEIKADKMPIGIYYLTVPMPFTNHEIKLDDGDTIYIFSDGFADQFGGERGRKYKYSNFKRILSEASTLPIEEQREMLNQVIDDWRSHEDPITGAVYEQLDDVLLVGVKF